MNRLLVLKKTCLCLALFGLLPASFGLTGCSATQEQAFLTNAPAVIGGSLVTANDLFAAYAAANQQLNGKALNPTTGLQAANAAAGSLASNAANLQTAVNNVFSGLNNLAASIKTANPNATPQQIATAQSAQLVAAQDATKAAAATTGPTAAVLRIHMSALTDRFIVEVEKAPSHNS